LSPQFLFGEDLEMKRLAKSYSIQSDKYIKLNLEEIKSQTKDLIEELPGPPKSNLEELKSYFKRSSDLFNAWIPCIMYFTKDK